jgi:hypothetical protein
MSPYANVVEGTRYPVLLVTTGINDPRVEPWLVAKFAARMQAATASGKPVLLSVDYNAGHYGGSSLDEALLGAVDLLAFMLWQTGHPEFQPWPLGTAPGCPARSAGTTLCAGLPTGIVPAGSPAPAHLSARHHFSVMVR